MRHARMRQGSRRLGSAITGPARVSRESLPGGRASNMPGGSARGRTELLRQRQLRAGDRGKVQIFDRGFTAAKASMTSRRSFGHKISSSTSTSRGSIAHLKYTASTAACRRERSLSIDISVAAIIRIFLAPDDDEQAGGGQPRADRFGQGAPVAAN